ncbi:MAG: exosortase B [Proteobacteria bacterium]|nr:exosortase B [Pseudomonadota bacterium]
MSAQRLSSRLPAGFDIPVAVMLCAGYLFMFAPTFRDLAVTIWSRDEQGHGPIILMVVLWLVYRKHETLFQLPTHPSWVAGSLWFALGLFMYVLGRSQAVAMLEVGALIPISTALLLLFKGPAAVRLLWFPLFFLLFMVPLPATLVVALTTPLKSAVSAVASNLLYSLGYPVGRSGVVLTVGPYQLLVADACAGLNSMFTLEALGLLYMNIMNYQSAARNLLMALAIVPISFVANIVRVCILVLVTYHFGDEAGQGFVHGCAGLVLFIVALSLILTFDHGLLALGRRLKWAAR